MKILRILFIVIFTPITVLGLIFSVLASAFMVGVQLGHKLISFLFEPKEERQKLFETVNKVNDLIRKKYKFSLKSLTRDQLLEKLNTHQVQNKLTTVQMDTPLGALQAFDLKQKANEVFMVELKESKFGTVSDLISAVYEDIQKTQNPRLQF